MGSDERSRMLVLSDMHFGTPESAINDARYREALVDHVCSNAPWARIVFTGDLLDANLSTLRRAIEGGRPRKGGDPLFGFREFLDAIAEGMRARTGEATLRGVADRWIYVPGNHDYPLWNWLVTRRMFMDVLDQGQRLGSAGPSPCMSGEWRDGSSFFAGLFAPHQVRDRVDVVYPHLVETLPGGGTMWLTHGHYADPSQTRFNDLADLLEPIADDRRRLRSERIRIFIETAQYQAVAHAVSFAGDTTGFVDQLFGPGGIGARIGRALAWITNRVQSIFFRREKASTGARPSARLLRNIDAYAQRFSEDRPIPEWFVFGHTHSQFGETKTPGGIRVANAGSCYPDAGRPITFIEVESGGEGGTQVVPMCVDAEGRVRRS